MSWGRSNSRKLLPPKRPVSLMRFGISAKCCAASAPCRLRFERGLSRQRPAPVAEPEQAHTAATLPRPDRLKASHDQGPRAPGASHWHLSKRNSPSMPKHGGRATQSAWHDNRIRNTRRIFSGTLCAKLRFSRLIPAFWPYPSCASPSRKIDPAQAYRPSEHSAAW